MVTWPTDFPGLVIDPNRQCVVNQVEVARFPVRICECFSECTNPGAPLPMIVECFIYGLDFGELDRGCPLITGGAFGLTLGTLETHFFSRLQLPLDTDFLAGGGSASDTALRFNLYLGKPVGVYEVYLVDNTGKRAWISFAPSTNSILWVNIPLSDFTILDVGFAWNLIRYIYFGFTNNFQPAECMMALDNVRVCTNQAGIGVFAFEPDSEPYGGNLPGDSCIMLEAFESESVLERVVCDAREPGPPTPEVCDECVIGPPLTNGNQAVHFCVDIIPTPFFPPSIRYIPAAPFTLTTNVTFTVYSWRPGVNVRVIMVDGLDRRAIYNFVAVGGAQTLTVPFASFTAPDAGFDWTNVVEWWTIFGILGVNSDDRFGLDELKTSNGTVVVHDMSTLTDIQCGYDPEPVAPGTTLTCEFVDLTSIFNPGPGTVKFDALTWEGALSIGTVSQTCDDPQGVWNLGFSMNDANAEVQIAFNLPVLPPSANFREIFLTLYDEVGRELMMEAVPGITLNPGDNLITVKIIGPYSGQPTLESKGVFDPARCVFWQIAFVGFSSLVYPFTVNFEGFRIRGGPGPGVTKTFLFDTYGSEPAFVAAGGYSCFEDWRLVSIAPPGTPFTFLSGAGVTVNTDPAWPSMTNVGVDRGRMPISVAGQEARSEVWCNPSIAPGGNWTSFELWYRARPDPGAPAPMHLIIQEDSGRTGIFSFANGSGALDADGARHFTTDKANFQQNLGALTNRDIRLVRLVKEGIDNQPRTGTPPTGQDIYSGDEVDFVHGRFFTGGISYQNVYGKNDNTTVPSVKVGKGSVGALGGDDQPSKFDGHVHHETEASSVTSGDLPPGGWPLGPPYGTPFDGWLKINKIVEGPTASMRVALPRPTDISGFLANPNAFWQIYAIGTGFSAGTLWTIRDIIIRLRDAGGGFSDLILGQDFGSGGSGYADASGGWVFNLNSSFPANDTLVVLLGRLIEKQDDGGGFDPTTVIGYDIIATGGWYTSKTWFFQTAVGEFTSGVTQIFNWNHALWGQLLGFANPANQFSVGRVLDPSMTPVVALNCDRTRSIAYWGMTDEWVRAAEIVLVPAKYKDDPIVGLNGNRGYDPLGNPLPGVSEALARDTRAWYGNIAFRVPPFAGCRNIWMDICYIDEVVCLGTDLEKALYQFWDTECPCYGPPEEISNLETDRWMDRILPDDQFILEPGAQPLPSGYPEAIRFEYCAIPECDQQSSVDTPDFTFLRKTPTCSRPDDPLNTVYGHYRVEVEITALNAPITVAWADALPPGETLISGAMSDTLNFITIGEVQKREYILKTAQIQGGSAIITGTATVLPAPPVPLASPAITMDVDCDTLSWHSFGSQDPNVFGQVFWAGGGRPDPLIPPNVKLWTKVYAGPGSAGLSGREQYLFGDATIPAQAGPFTTVLQLGGTGIEGFSVGLPVWVFNTDFVDNPVRRITGLDIEAEEISANPNEEVTGLYGIVDSIDPVLMTVTVQFPNTLDQQVRFTMLAKACMMVAPDQSRGYYWEASPALVDLCKLVPYTDPGVHHTVLRWGFRYWNSTHNPAPGTNGAAYICDGDGESYLYELHGEAPKEIINPVDWMDLLCSPVLETKLLNDAIPAQTDVRVCDICLFDPCSIIQIVDENCTGKEGSGPGYIGSVITTIPDDPMKPCASLYATEGHVQIIAGIPAAVSGCGLIDGFKTTRRARAFVKPDVARYAYSPTTKVYPNGVPVEGQNFVGVDFATGTFTFIPEIVLSNPCACFRALNAIISLPRNEQQALISGIYFLKGIDKSGCKSPPSKPIKVVGAITPEGNTCGVGRSPTLLFQNQYNGPEVEIVGDVTTLVVGSTISFVLASPSRVEIRVSIRGFDVEVGSRGQYNITGWTDMYAKDETSGTFHPLSDRLARGQEGGQEAAGADSGAGSVMSRVMDLPAGNHTFNIYIQNGNPAWATRLRFPMDLQAWRFGLCTPPM